MRASGRQTHQAENASHLLVIHDLEKRRLFQLDRQALAKRAVEDRIAGLVVEIGEDNGVLVGESRSAMEVEIRRGGQRQNRGGSRNDSSTRLGRR